MASIAAADRLPRRLAADASAGRCRSSRRCRGGGWRRAASRRAGDRKLVRRQDSRRRRSGSSPASAKCAARRRRSGRSRCAPRRAGRPSRPRQARRVGAGKGQLASPSSGAAARGASSVTRASGRFHGSRPGDRLARDFDRQRRAFGHARRAARAADIRRRRSSTATALRPRFRRCQPRGDARSRRAITPSSWIRASTISPSSTSAARVSPIPRSMSHSGNRISRRSSAARAFRRAAGRRRWNSCRRCGGHRPRHSPGAHSRRPCRATRRGWRNSRSLPSLSRFIAIIVSTSRSRTPWPGTASATPVSTRWRRPDSSRMQARSVASSSTFGRMRRPDRDDRVRREHQRVRLLRRDGFAPSRARAAAHARAAARPWARFRRCRRERPRRASTPMRASRSRRRGLAEARISRMRA